jgi:hypothetical protein
MRREDVSDGSAAEDGGAHRLDGERREEDPLARTQDGRMDEKAVLVDQAGPDQRSGEPCPAVGEQVVSTAITGFLTRNNDRHPARACPARFTRTGHAGGGLLAAQPDAYSRSRAELNGIGSRPGASSSRW